MQYLRNRPQQDNPQKALLRAISRSDSNGIQSALAAGADLNARDNNGITPLLMAAKNGNLAMVEYLASQGADVNASDDQGHSALDRAETWDFPENLQYQDDFEGNFLGYQLAPINRLAECLVKYGMRRDSNTKSSSFGFYDRAFCEVLAPDNVMVRHAIAKKTDKNFWLFYQAWETEMGFKLLGMDDAKIKGLFNHYCAIVFEAEKKEPVNSDFPVRDLPVESSDVGIACALMLAIKKICEKHYCALERVGLDRDFRFIRPIDALQFTIEGNLSNTNDRSDKPSSPRRP